MTKRMLIDANHREETRVVVLDGTRLEEFDVESSTKKQLKGNIYLAKVVRVEPSLQAAFVDYGGNRHGFLAFNEIHPDYYQIPVADREALLAQQRDDRNDSDDDGDWQDTSAALDPAETPQPDLEPLPDAVSEPKPDTDSLATTQDAAGGAATDAAPSEPALSEPEDAPKIGPIGPIDPPPAIGPISQSPAAEPEPAVEPAPVAEPTATPDASTDEPRIGPITPPEPVAVSSDPSEEPEPVGEVGADPQTETVPEAVESAETAVETASATDAGTETDASSGPAPGDRAIPAIGPIDMVQSAVVVGEGAEVIPADPETGDASEVADPEVEGDAANDVAANDQEDDRSIETLGGDEAEEEEEEEPRRARKPRSIRQYKIQEVIKRRQILLVQVVKEERGNKGAALTTYLSLAGRYCVFMPNTTRGGGVSRKITNNVDRKRLKTIMSELQSPAGSAVILRTAGAERSKSEVKRDFDYLLRTWDTIRTLTLESRAPAAIHEEASLIRRAIRDIYTRDIEEVWVEGETGYRTAKDFMKLLTPSHAKKVQPYREEVMPLFHRYQVESQMDAMHSPTAQLRSGGYIVINQTEALVAIDVNSGRSTKERNIEDTAYKTNLEAADEIARQLRLRDLSGLIVIDFIDMEDNRSNANVERRLKEALKSDRARIQVGRISHFGLLELSRQRLRPSIMETSFQTCPHCNGTGVVRSLESTAVHTLRLIEEEGVRRRSSEVTMHVPTEVALYILNVKRDVLRSIEERYMFKVYLQGDHTLVAPDYRMDRVKADRGDDGNGMDDRSSAPSGSGRDDETAAQRGPEPANDAEEPESRDSTDDDDGQEDADGNRKRKRRRRRRGRRDEGDDQDTQSQDDDNGASSDADGDTEVRAGSTDEADSDGDDDNRRRRRRGRGRGRGRNRSESAQSGVSEDGSETAPEGAMAETDPQGSAGDASGDDERRGRRRRRRRRNEEDDGGVSGSSYAAAPVFSGDIPADPDAIAEAMEAGALQPTQEVVIGPISEPEPIDADTIAAAHGSNMVAGGEAVSEDAPQGSAPLAEESVSDDADQPVGDALAEAAPEKTGMVDSGPADPPAIGPIGPITPSENVVDTSGPVAVVDLTSGSDCPVKEAPKPRAAREPEPQIGPISPPEPDPEVGGDTSDVEVEATVDTDADVAVATDEAEQTVAETDADAEDAASSEGGSEASEGSDKPNRSGWWSKIVS